MAQSPVDYGAVPEDIENRATALVMSEPELDVKCTKCGELVCSQRRAVALGWWFGAVVVGAVVGVAALTRSAHAATPAAAAATQLAIATENLPSTPSAPALALLKAFDRDGAGALNLAELTTMLAAQTAAQSNGAKTLSQAAGEAQATKLLKMFDADASAALDAVELTRALEIQEASRAAKQTPGEKLTADNDNPMTADDTWDCQGASGRCDESSTTSSSKTSKSKKATKGTKSTDSGSDDAVNCSTHDDCNDLYPDQLDDNWLAVTDDKKPTKKLAKSATTDDETRSNEWHKHAHSSTCKSDDDCSSKYTCESGQCMPYQPDASSATKTFNAAMGNMNSWQCNYVCSSDSDCNTLSGPCTYCSSKGSGSAGSCVSEEDDTGGTGLNGDDDVTHGGGKRR